MSSSINSEKESREIMDLCLTRCHSPEFADAIDFLDHQIRSGVKLGLESTERLLATLGNPHHGQKYIHVAGTNGKGSVTTLLTSALMAQGLKVGMYTSPHLINIRERYRINLQPISEFQFAQLMDEIRLKAGHLFGKEGSPSFFELCTVLAFLYFNREKCDVSVIEVGLGGRLDATNVITPELSVITRIDLDHQRILGPDRYTIAGEKAGIMKPNKPVVIGFQYPDAMQRLKEEASLRNLTPYILEEHVQPLYTRIDKESWTQENHWIHHGQKEMVISGLIGEYQLENVALAWGCLHHLKELGWSISLEKVRKVWPKVRWAVRFDRLKPYFIIDGAHNLNGVTAFTQTIRLHFPEIPRWRIFFGVLEAKQWKEMLDLLIPLGQEFIVTGIHHPKAASPAILVDYIQSQAPQLKITVVSKITEIAHELLRSDQPTLGVGSLYMLGEFLSILYQGDPVCLCGHPTISSS